ncbi:uncharacterized protein IL334_001029 [Kwoniella shivajii]|uniref:Phosphoinositide phospholipase C n=1 Tax=Kwoniella shivajii TaxID=564305 RepID=A0ABZ1CSC8_9TREE|nr:hypothetical protein IL334_001029 [Kwoniella shivajii]
MSSPSSPTINYFSMLRLTQKGLKSPTKIRSAPVSPIHSEPVSPISDEADTYFPSVPAPSPQCRIRRRFTVPSSWSNFSSSSPYRMDSTAVDGLVPTALVHGVPMLKISSRKMKQVIIRIRNGGISWSSKKDNTVLISEVRDLRLGQPPSDTYNSSRWITIVYVRGTQWKVLHMVALTDEIYGLWVQTLKSLVSISTDRHITDITPADPDLIWIRQLWPIGSKVIDSVQVEALCNQIGLQIPDIVKKSYIGSIDIATFHQLIKDCQTRPEIAKIYNELTEEGSLDRDKVDRFLKETQNLSNPEGIFEKFRSKTQSDQDIWSLASLTEFLCSPDNATTVQQDMTHPIQHYYISSSHNTYLVGEQWRGESTVEGYIRVLLAGCRCVEMDVQSGDNEPVVYHRKTLTSSVSVRDICRAINQYAFVASPYPVIISAEIHCSLEQQHRLANILTEVFGDKLVTAPISGEYNDLPSPEQLKNRILFKAKPPKPEARSPRLSATFSSPDSATSSTDTDSGFARLTRRLSISSNNSNHNGKNEKPDTFSNQLLDLLVYTTGVKYKGFSKLIEYEMNEQFSVSDRTAIKIAKDNGGENKNDWIKHNFNHISRVYPRGTKLTSSNYDPTIAWSAGCQLVALNWQTLDEGTLLNHGMFHSSNGYILKPIALRQKVIEISTRYRITIQIISGQRMPLSPDLYVEVTLKPSSNRSSWSSTSASSGSSRIPGSSSSSSTPSSASSPSTPVSPLTSYSNSNSSHSNNSTPSSPTFRKTKTSRGITLNPNWDETFKFDIKVLPSNLMINFIHMEIKTASSSSSSSSSNGNGNGNGNGSLLAQYIKPISLCPKGFHHLPLYDPMMSKYVFATLFTKIDVEEILGN